MTIILSVAGLMMIMAQCLQKSRKKAAVNLVLLIGYSVPLYYLMLCKGAGGAGFTWWLYLIVLTTIHLVVMLCQLVAPYINRRRH